MKMNKNKRDLEYNLLLDEDNTSIGWEFMNFEYTKNQKYV